MGVGGEIGLGAGTKEEAKTPIKTPRRIKANEVSRVLRVPDCGFAGIGAADGTDSIGSADPVGSACGGVNEGVKGGVKAGSGSVDSDSEDTG